MSKARTSSLQFFVSRAMSTAETAEALSLNEDVVKTRFSRARRALQQDLLDRAGAAAVTAFTFGQGRCDRVVNAVLRRLGAAPTLSPSSALAEDR